MRYVDIKFVLGGMRFSGRVRGRGALLRRRRRLRVHMRAYGLLLQAQQAHASLVHEAHVHLRTVLVTAEPSLTVPGMAQPPSEGPVASTAKPPHRALMLVHN